MPELHETMLGKMLLERDIPELVHHLNKIGRELEKANHLKEAELVLRKKELENSSK